MEFKRKIQKIRDFFELSFSLAKAEFKLRNEGSYLGILWYLLDPLTMFLIILFLGEAITRTDIQNYPTYLLLGLIMFNFFRQSTSSAAETMTRNSGFIKSIKISYESLVFSPIIQFVFSHFFEIILFILIALTLNMLNIGILFYPIIFIFLIIFSLGISFILATIGAYVTDLGNVWRVLMNLLWFATPVFYIIPEGKISFLNKINPMYYFLEIGREIVVYNRLPSLNIMLFIIFLSFVSFLIGIILFNKYKHKFAELV